MSDTHIVTSQLETALASRIVIEQAKGMVAEHNGVNVDEAFTMLRGYARSSNHRLRQVAETVLDGTLDAGELTASAGGGNQPAGPVPCERVTARRGDNAGTAATTKRGLRSAVNMRAGCRVCRRTAKGRDFEAA
jgi:hypothetical protein